MLGAYRKAVGVLNHPLMYLAGNYCYRINAIAPPGGLGESAFATYLYLAERIGL